MRTGSLQLPGVVAALALGLLLNGAARAGDILEEAKAKQAIEAQRVEKMVSEARTTAYGMRKTRPADAVEILKGALRSLEADTALKADKRDMLIRSLKNDIRDLQSEARDPQSGIPADPGRSGRLDDDRRRAEADSIRRTQAEIRAMRDAGRNDEARRAYDELARRFPGNPSIQAGSTSTTRAGAIAAANDIRQQLNEGRLMVYKSETKSMLVPTRDVEFPRNWAEKMAKHTPNRMTEKEKAIMKALNTVIPVEFEMATFQQVLDYLEKKTGQALILDKQAMTEANVTYDTPITMKAKTTFRTVLKRMLGDLNLAYVVKEENIQITSLQKARETLSTRTYYIGDLVGATDLRFGPFIARAQMAAQVQELAVLITQVVEPESWMVNDKGGLGTIAFYPVTMSFVVRQTAEIHHMMGLGFR